MARIQGPGGVILPAVAARVAHALDLSRCDTRCCAPFDSPDDHVVEDQRSIDAFLTGHGLQKPFLTCQQKSNVPIPYPHWAMLVKIW